jgi:hypothetical protein
LSSATEYFPTLKRRARVGEAMIFLLIVKYLIRAVQMRRWRATLGRVGELGTAEGHPAYRAISYAVTAGARRLPGEYVCLPRAMAVQWMLRRRGVASAIVIGVSAQPQGDRLHALHAWVEGGGNIIIGDHSTSQYVRGLTLVQP